MQEPARGTSPRDGGVDAEKYFAVETRPLDYLRNSQFTAWLGFTAFGISQLNWLGLQAVVYVMIGLALLWAAVANYLGEV